MTSEPDIAPSSESVGVAVWAPARPVASAPLDFQDTDLFEVQVLSEDEGPRLVAAIELVSPANKDRPANCRMFAVKCASYLQCGVSLIIVDVVTERSGNLHAELLGLLQTPLTTAGPGSHDLYAVAHRAVAAHQGLHMEVWAHHLSLGDSLPTLPLWLQPNLCLPLDLESSYLAACAARRIVS